MNSKTLLVLSLATNIVLAGSVVFCLEQVERIARLALARPMLFTSVRIVTNALPVTIAEPAGVETAGSIDRIE